MYVDVGRNGRISDGGVFKNSTLGSAISRNSLNFSEETPLPGRTKPIPYVIVADAAFPVSYNILKPFPLRNMTWSQRVFNYRLSRARRVVENAFGILTSRFRVLLNSVNFSPQKTQTITLECVAIHNFLRTKYPRSYDILDNNRDKRLTYVFGISQQAGNRANQSALNNRDEFMEYVNGVRAVDWQNELS